MKRQKPSLVSVVMLGVIVFVMTATAATTLATQTEKSGWSKKMQRLYVLTAELLTDVSSTKRFNSPLSRGRIEKNATELSQLAHTLKRGSPDADPAVTVFAELFADETKHAVMQFKRGNRDYARTRLQGIPNYCIACHTRTNTGPSFTSLPLEPKAKDLNWSERATFFAATRQYDRALDLYRKIVLDPRISDTSPIEWEAAVRHALAITVRAKKDPSLSMDIVDRVISAPSVPDYLRQDAIRWKASIQEWKDEGSRKSTTEQGLYAEATRLMDQAAKVQRYTYDRSADIVYLRASSVIHDLMNLAPEGEYRQKAFLLAGVCYEVLGPLNLGELSEIYFEGCIRTEPHTPVAKTCFERFERATYMGYSGSGGTYIPDDVLTRLRELRTLAGVKAPRSTDIP